MPEDMCRAAGRGPPDRHRTGRTGLAQRGPLPPAPSSNPRGVLAESPDSGADEDSQPGYGVNGPGPVTV